MTLDARSKIVLFDGRRGHEVAPFEGERFSLVFFTCGQHTEMQAEDRQLLEKNGFKVPDQEQLERLFTFTPYPSTTRKGAKMHINGVEEKTLEITLTALTKE